MSMGVCCCVIDSSNISIVSRTRCSVQRRREASPATLLRRAGTVTDTGAWYGPGSAEGHEEWRTGSGTQLPPLCRDLVERHVLVHPDIAGQPEHALGDDVAQDLVGAAGDAH